MEFEPALGGECAQLFQARAVRGRIELRGHHNHRLFRQRRAERGQLVLDNLKIAHRVAIVRVARIHQVRDQPRALDVLQEADPQPYAFVRAFDQARQIGHDKRAPLPGAASGSAETTPRCGSSVVKGYAAIFGRAAEMREISVDFPAFGKPTSPTSASNFNSSRRWRSSPGRPSSCSRGA